MLGTTANLQGNEMRPLQNPVGISTYSEKSPGMQENIRFQIKHKEKGGNL